MNRALFLDRDGVLDELVNQGGEWSAPLEASQVRLRPGVREALDLAAKHGWLIFVISNQPDAAKGKTTMESLRAVHERGRVSQTTRAPTIAPTEVASSTP